MPYFVDRLEQAFGLKSRFALTLIVPQRPILSVVEGAANLGITDGYIKARILRLTYGLLQSVPEAEHSHPVHPRRRWEQVHGLRLQGARDRRMLSPLPRALQRGGAALQQDGGNVVTTTVHSNFSVAMTPVPAHHSLG